jgi:type I restriction enzyme S subunit
MSASNSILKEIREIVSFEKGKPPAQQPYFGSDAEIYLTPEYLRGGAATEPIKASANAVRVKQGDSIVLWDGSNAGEVFKAREGVLSSTMTRLRHGDEFDVSYFFYAVKGWESHLKGQTSGSGIPHVDKEVLGKLKIAKFPQAEQTKIAEILSTVDRAIEQTEALIAKQQRLKTGLMQDLLTRGIDEHGNLRSEQTHKFKDSPLGRIPVEWEVKRIDELLANVDPPMRSGPFGSALLKEELVDAGIPLLGIDNVHTEKFVAQFSRFVDPKKAQTLKRYYVRPRDIMITIMGTVGRCCVVPDQIGTALSSKHTWTISLDQEIYSSYLACLQINHAPWVLNHFAKDEQGGIMSSIKSDTLRSTLLPVPPMDELMAIEARMKSLTGDYEIKVDLLKKLRALKTALMQEFLTGRKRVTTLLDGKDIPT